MKPVLRSVIVAVLVACVVPTSASGQTASSTDSTVPKGEVLQFSFDQSNIFPGTFRDYWVYVPAQYTPDNPACVYVNQGSCAYH